MSIAKKLTLAAENVPMVYEAGKNDFRDEFEKWFTTKFQINTPIIEHLITIEN